MPDVDPAVPTSAADWRALVEAMPQIVWVTRPDGHHVHFNQRWMDFTGLTLEESIGFGWIDAFHPDDQQRTAARWEQATASGEPYEIEYRLRDRDGHDRWMLGRAQPLRDGQGDIVSWMGTCTDIHEQKRAQAHLERSRTLQRIAGRAARIGGWSIDVAANTVEWSEGMYDIHEFPRDNAVDLRAAMARYVPEDRELLDAALDACVTDGTPFDLELRLDTYAGNRRWVRAIGEARWREDGPVTHLFGALQDITGRREAARRNEVLADRLTTTLESITDGFVTLDRDWRFTYVNRQGERILDRRRHALLGRDIRSIYPELVGTDADKGLHQAMHEQVTVVLPEYRYPGLDRRFELNIYPSDEGSAVYFRDVTEQQRDRQALRERIKELEALATISRQAHALDDPVDLVQVTANALAVAVQEPGTAVVRVQLDEASARAGSAGHDGTPPEPVVHHAPIVSAGERRGSIEVRSFGSLGLIPEERSLFDAVAETLALWSGWQQANEALEQLNAELNTANTQLAAASQLKDDLLSMASHELRTPLTPIMGFLELLESRGDNLREEQRRTIRSMRSNTQRMLRLVEDLLVVSRATAQVLASRPENLPADDVVRSVLDELDEVLPRVDLALDGCRLDVDPQHLQQILINLLTNAAKYGHPPITISARAGDHGRVALEVADRGPGVDADFRDRMWERFEQKDRGDARTARGAGLGLAIIKLLAETNGGRVDYRDASPTGAVFVIELPGSLRSATNDVDATEVARRDRLNEA